MLVTVLRRFNDAREKVTREEGDVFECEPERYSEIMAKYDDLIVPFEDQATGEAEGAKSASKPAAKSTRKTSKAKTSK